MEFPLDESAGVVGGSPSWHEPVLLEREELLARGGTEFVDWETAKAELRKKLK